MIKLTYEYLNEEYTNKKRSLADIAKDFKSYPNAIRRQLIKYGISLRDKSDAQREALLSGRHQHPTLGKVRTNDEKRKIGDSVSENWKNLDEGEKAKRAETSKNQWNSMSEEKKQDIRSRAAKGVRRAAEEGSATEKYMVGELRKAGYVVDWHKKSLVSNEELEVDIYLSQLKTAIEIDGKFHSEVIFSDEQLTKTQISDQIKNGLLTTSGINVIRAKVSVQNVSGSFHRQLFQKIFARLKHIEEFAPLPIEERLWYIE